MAGFADLFSILESKVSIDLNIGQGYKYVDPDGSSDTGLEPCPSSVYEMGRDYAQEVKEREEEEWRNQMLGMQAMSLSDRGSIYNERDTTVSSSAHMEDLTTIGTHAVPADELGMDESYENFDWSQKSKNVLPIDADRNKILDHVQSNIVSIIKGATGCGKSTQLPMYLLEDCRNKKKSCQIVVTQPRRIAAVSVAERVCRERGWRVGDLVGYQIGQNRVASDHTKLLYCTTGVLLQRLVKQKSIDSLTHIILDEIHERDKDMDFLMIVVRKLMRYNHGKTRIVLMSATLDHSRLQTYFSNWSQETNSFQRARVFQISETHPHMIYKFFLEQIATVDPHLYKKLAPPNPSRPGISPEHYLYASSLVQSFDNLEERQTKKVCGAVLIFLPGIHEITEMHTALEEFLKKSKNPQLLWKIVILHSTIPKEQQDLVFTRPPPEVRKIVLSTNIAESSITVSDIKYVIDFCLTKSLTVAEGSNYSTLQLEWCSDSSCQQRAGRVGRVSEGRVYYMVTKDFYHQLPIHDVPEMQRSPLDSLVLHAKMLDMGPPVHIFGLAMDPPDIGNIKRTILTLKEIGALFPTTDDDYLDDDGDITYMGQVMSCLPVDPRVAKLIYLGYVFNILDDCVIMAAAMSVKSPFSSPYREELEAYCSKLIWADSTCSDLIAFLNLYKVWHSQKTRGFFDRSRGHTEKNWARQNFVQISSLREIEKLVTDIMTRLRHQEIRMDPDFKWAPHERPIILKILIGGAFYPNYFFRGKDSAHIDEKDALKTLSGHDPMNTVYLKGLPSSQVELMPLYASEIKKHMRFCHPDDMKVTADSSKVFIQFKSQSGKTSDNRIEYIPGAVNVSVFKAVKLRQVCNSLSVKCYKDSDCVKKVEELGLQIRKDGVHIFGEAGVAGPTERFISIRIVYVDTLSKFWAQLADCHHELEIIHDQINTPDNMEALRGPPKIGAIYVAPFEEKYYRVRVLRLNKNQALVKYIDYGNDGEIHIREILNFGPSLADQDLAIRKPFAFECSLAEVAPSIFRDHHGLWSKDAIGWFTNEYLNRNYALIAEIYSIVDGIVKLILYHDDKNTVNSQVVYRGYATEIEEPYRSKLDHDNRIRNLCCEGLNDIDTHTVDLEQEPDDDDRKKVTISLNGPYSPLETSVFAPLRSVNMKPIRIDRESVNCVLLETEPQDNPQRVLVSAFCSANPTSEILKVRETTLMPNIPSLPAMLCMLFAPQVELRMNADRTRVIGALCGLGYRDIEGKFEALYPENDMEITFNIEINNAFLTYINSVRLCLDEVVTVDSSDIRKRRHGIRKNLLKLLQMNLPSADSDFFKNRFRWGQVDRQHLRNPRVDPTEHHPSELSPHVYHLIWGVDFDKKKPESVNTVSLYHNLMELKLVADGVIPMKNVRCDLCKTHLEDHQTLRVHLSTKRHEQHVRWLEGLAPPPPSPLPPPTRHMSPYTHNLQSRPASVAFAQKSPLPPPDGVYENVHSRAPSRNGPSRGNSRAPSRNGPPSRPGSILHSASPQLMPPHSFVPVRPQSKSRLSSSQAQGPYREKY